MEITKRIYDVQTQVLYYQVLVGDFDKEVNFEEGSIYKVPELFELPVRVMKKLSANEYIVVKVSSMRMHPSFGQAYGYVTISNLDVTEDMILKVGYTQELKDYLEKNRVDKARLEVEAMSEILVKQEQLLEKAKKTLAYLQNNDGSKADILKAEYKIAQLSDIVKMYKKAILDYPDLGVKRDEF